MPINYYTTATLRCQPFTLTTLCLTNHRMLHTDRKASHSDPMENDTIHAGWIGAKAQGCCMLMPTPIDGLATRLTSKVCDCVCLCVSVCVCVCVYVCVCVCAWWLCVAYLLLMLLFLLFAALYFSLLGHWLCGHGFHLRCCFAVCCRRKPNEGFVFGIGTTSPTSMRMTATKSSYTTTPRPS